jgi:hypothetical protein
MRFLKGMVTDRNRMHLNVANVRVGGDRWMGGDVVKG